jgi:hypothetical protein
MSLRALKYLIIFSLFTGTLLFGSSLYAQQSEIYSILVTGNTNSGLNDSSLFFEWRKQLELSTNIACLFTGNVINKKGNPELPIDDEESENPLLITPGKAEWLNGSKQGKEFIIQLESELSGKLKKPVYFPEAACPGPKEIDLDEHVVVVLLDTYWWVHKFDRRFNKCDIESQADVLMQIEDAIRRNYSSKHVILAGNHTLKSYGNTSGYFSLKQWLVEAPKTFFRKFPGTKSDIPYPDFKEFRNGVLSILKKYPDVIYVSGGEANLQYFQNDRTHFVVSGSWCSQEYVRKNLPEFGASENGFARLDFETDGDCFLTFFSSEKVLFKKMIYKKDFLALTQKSIENNSLPDSTTAAASYKYRISPSKYKLLGKNYRNIWETPVNLPIFDIGNKNGGLSVIKRGGGQQTYSLRLENSYGNQFVLRSIDKYVEGALPQNLHNTFAVDIVQDQISASNPYAAPVVASLAQYAHILHTNPEIFFVPDDPRFGIYRPDVANKFFLFEDRLDGDYLMEGSSDISAKVISTADVIESIIKDHDHTIDKEALLRARLFDLLINDWDRHDDQWRWTGFEQNNKTVYEPIPRDRDQAFFLNEGILPWLTARNWLLPKIQGFDELTENVEGQSFNARYFDRTFLTNCSWHDWLIQIDSLKFLLSNYNIDSAMLAFPTEIYPYCGPETGRILKIRRENLEKMAHDLYLSLAKEVSIFGTNEDDCFEISSIKNNLRISGYKLKKNGKKGDCFYNREFVNNETKTINLYGLDGIDRFEQIGNYASSIKLKIIGGSENDQYEGFNLTSKKYVSVYDKKKSNSSPEIRGIIKNKFDKDELKFNREHFEYDIVYPGIYSGYNPDDGIFLGGGPIFTKYSRYQKRRYEILGNYAMASNSYSLRFDARNSYLLRHVDINFNSGYNSGGYAGNFFGLGNESNRDADKNTKDFYRLRLRRYFAQLDFVKWIDNNEVHKAGPGLQYLFADAEDTPNRFVDFPDNGLNPTDLLAHSYAVFYFKYELNTLAGKDRDVEGEFAGSNMFPIRGMQMETRASYFSGLNQNTDNFFKLSTDWISYLSFSQRPRMVYAFRIGGEKLFGDYAFHESAKLGNNENLRGYRETRFYGDASCYVNTEVRIRMKKFQSYILNGTAGVLFFNDIGRVWLNGEKSKRWHNGAGLGFWFSPFDMALLNVSYAISNEDQLLNFSVNYQF